MKINIVGLSVFGAIMTLLMFCRCSNEDSTKVKIDSTDSLKNKVKIINQVTIGHQVWMTENLNVDTFANGDSIIEAKTEQEWINALQNKQPAWCYYNNDFNNGLKYGKLYNFFALSDIRGLAPTGWCIPTRDDWRGLFSSFGYNGEGAKMKNTNGWEQYGNGSNVSGFSALPGGHRSWNGRFENVGYLTEWWCLDYSYIPLYWNRDEIEIPGIVESYRKLEDHGFSVRCLKGNCNADLLATINRNSANAEPTEQLSPIIGIPIKIGKLEIAQHDFETIMEWDDAKMACVALGNGWRLPTKEELNILYQNKEAIGMDSFAFYWSSSVGDLDGVWTQFFFDGSQSLGYKGDAKPVRAVRAF
jgi:uncharacterized protein (TIGR02145 family)